MSGGAQPTVAAALCLHGRITSWVGTKSHSASWLNASRRSLARFAADSYRRHVLASNRQLGLAVAVYIHSWNPELASLYDELYAPAAQIHEPAQPGLRAVASQALSMKRCLALVPDNVAIVMVARPDALFYTNVPLAHVLAKHREQDGLGAPALWLPHTCQHNLRTHKQQAADLRAVRAPSPWDERDGMYETCGCGRRDRSRKSSALQCGRGISGMGSFYESPELTRVFAGGSDASLHHSLYVLDWFFVATLPLARSFGTIYANFTDVATAMRLRGFRGPPWAHFYWAHHIAYTVVRRYGAASVRFLGPLVNGRDVSYSAHAWELEPFRAGTLCPLPACTVRFTRACARSIPFAHNMTPASPTLLRSSPCMRWQFILARFARFGINCEVRVPTAALPRLARTINATRAHLATREIDPALEHQCPPRLQRGTTLLCPWYTPACATGASTDAAAGALAALRRAETALHAEGLNLSHAFDRFVVPRGMRAILDTAGEAIRVDHADAG